MEKDPFHQALDLTLRFEGGYVNHPADRGGATNRGITQVTYDAHRKHLDLPLQPVLYVTEDEAAAIYERCYWIPNRCEELPAMLAVAHFDACVNHGGKNAGRILQRACMAEVDGIVGPATVAACLAKPENWLISRQLHFRLKFFEAIVERDRSQAVFLAGWCNRLNQLADFFGVGRP